VEKRGKLSRMDFFRLMTLISSLETLVPWLKDIGLLPHYVPCQTCLSKGIESKRTKIKDRDTPEGEVFRCKICKKKTALRHGTLFSGKII